MCIYYEKLGWNSRTAVPIDSCQCTWPDDFSYVGFEELHLYVAFFK